VALGATAVVAAVYLLISGAVVALATGNLTAQVDRRLDETLDHIVREPRPKPMGRFEAPSDGDLSRRLTVVWTVSADGRIQSNEDAELPPEYRSVAAPATVSVEGTPFRVTGGAAGDRYVIVGESLKGVSEAASTIVLAELLIAPVLLGLVFLGAVTIGRRVAGPIERARRRQLEFTADASHELRTPLSVVEAQASLALSQARSNDWYRGAFERIDVESKRMRRLVEDLLWLARFDATGRPSDAEPVDLGILAAQTADRFGPVAEARQLALSVEAAPGTNVVTAPPEWLDRLLGVLLDNACKYSPDGGAVRVSVSGEGGRIRLTVDDSGPGIPEGERPRIFDRFHRATASGGGAGLGLAIADAIVRATGGRWRVGASPSGGASMSVTWPRTFAGHPEPLGQTPSVRTRPTD
jgi:signal transduction histidine kinase